MEATVTTKEREETIEVRDDLVPDMTRVAEWDEKAGVYITAKTALSSGSTFMAHREDGRLITNAKVTVSWPELKWGEPQEAQLTIEMPYGMRDAATTMIMARLMETAADYANALYEAYEPIFGAAREEAERRRAEAEAARAQREAEYRERRERDNAWRQEVNDLKAKYNAECKEALQWYLGQRGRLQRVGARSTIQCTDLIEVHDHGIVYRTERNDIYRDKFWDIAWFEIKYEGDRSYTRIDLPAKPVLPERPSRY